MKKINLKALFVISFPLVFFLVLHLTLNYMQRTDLVGYLVVGPLGAISMIWWKWAKHFIFATDIKIVPEEKDVSNG